MRRAAFRDWRFWCLLAAAVCLAAALVKPGIQRVRPSFNILVVIDITGSMNVRDGELGGEKISRLDFVKHRLRGALGQLPCRSNIALGVFTERRSFLLTEPMEICDNLSVIDGTLSKLNWRMAWEGDSYVASGLSHAIQIAESLDADLLFLTDGHQAPPHRHDWEERFEAGSGQVKGLIAGVGGHELSPIPKFDVSGRETGFYNVDDVPHESRVGPPPQEASGREGWHPRNAPYGAVPIVGTEHLSSVREDHLKLLAEKTGIDYHHLESVEGLVDALIASSVEHPIQTRIDVSAVPAGLALILLITAYLPPLGALLGRHRRGPSFSA